MIDTLFLMSIPPLPKLIYATDVLLCLLGLMNNSFLEKKHQVSQSLSFLILHITNAVNNVLQQVLLYINTPKEDYYYKGERGFKIPCTI